MALEGGGSSLRSQSEPGQSSLYRMKGFHLNIIVYKVILSSNSLLSLQFNSILVKNVQVYHNSLHSVSKKEIPSYENYIWMKWK